MTRRRRRLCLALPLIGVAGLLTGGLATCRGGDALNALPQPAAPVLVDAAAEIEDGRQMRDLVFEDPKLGRIGLVVSLPHPLPPEPLPVVVVLGGLRSGRENIEHVPAAGDNVVVGYDWPVPPELPRGFGLVWRAPELRRRLFAVPGQVAAALEWVSAQPWADTERISLLGFSLGAMAAPAAQRVAQARGQPVGWTVLAYGGADLGHLLANHPRAGPRWARPVLGWLGGRLLRPVEPAVHLPHLAGRFLVIGGAEDALVPERSARLMRELTPEPKEIVLLEGDHMGVGPGQEALLEEIVSITRAWLLEEAAINPPPAEDQAAGREGSPAAMDRPLRRRKGACERRGASWESKSAAYSAYSC